MAVACLLGRVVHDPELGAGAEEQVAQPERVGHAAADRVPDTLGQAGSPARVRQEDILLAAAHPRRRLGPGNQLLVAARSRPANTAGILADLDEQANPGTAWRTDATRSRSAESKKSTSASQFSSSARNSAPP